MDPVDRQQYELAITSLHTTGLELSEIARQCSPDLRWLLLEDLEQLELSIARIRALAVAVPPRRYRAAHTEPRLPLRRVELVPGAHEAE